MPTAARRGWLPIVDAARSPIYRRGMLPASKRKTDPTKLPRVALLAVVLSWPIVAYAWGELYSTREWSAAKLVDAKTDSWSKIYSDGTRGPIDGHDLKNNAGIAWFAGAVHATMFCGFAGVVCLAWWFSTFPRR